MEEGVSGCSTWRKDASAGGWEKVQDTINTVRERLMPLRILLIGSTGSGKSSLIKKVFGFDSSDDEGPKTGYGRPVTKFEDIEKEWRDPRGDAPIILHDSKGSELGDMEYNTKLSAWIQSRQEKREVRERIHMIWYFVNLELGRFQDFDERLCKEIIAPRGIPVIMVLTKRDSVTSKEEDTMRAIIHEMQLPSKILKGVFAVSIYDTPVSAMKPKQCQRAPECTSGGFLFDSEDQTWSCKRCGATWDEMFTNELPPMLERCYEILPETLQASLASAQKVSKSIKITACVGIVATNVVIAASIGASPIPFSDAAVLVPMQTAMMASLAAIWGIYVWRFPKLVMWYAGAQTLTVLSGTTLANGLKLLFGAGSALGMVINAGVAACLTGALGVGYTAAFHAVVVRWPSLSIDDSDQVMDVMRPFTDPEYIIKLAAKFQRSYKCDQPLSKELIQGFIQEAVEENEKGKKNN